MFQEALEWIVGKGNDLLWSYVLIYLLLGVGVWFTIRTKFVQVRLFGEMFRLITEKKDDKDGISPFQAFAISAASRVGTGNVTGVALAIGIGGPGAVFWMWVVALVGMATAFIESTLAQVYKVRDGDTFRGGPAYYMEKALGNRPMGIVFAILLTLSFGFIFNAVQANTIKESFSSVFAVPGWAVGLVLIALAAVVIFGGVKRIASVTQFLVPIMAVIYLLVVLVVLVIHFEKIPAMFSLIVSEAFGLREAAGGAVGAAIMQGVRRGLFSNEAGMGSVPNAAATASVSHPAKQGLVQSLGVFFDTIIICSATAFMIILAGVYETTEQEGIVLTQASLDVLVGSWAPYFIAVAIFFFAFSSILGNYYYGESNIEFMRANRAWLTAYRIGVLAMVMFGSLTQVQLVWNMADLFMGTMAIINLIAIVLLGKVAYRVLDDFLVQRRRGLNPDFHASSLPNLKGAECWENREQE